MHTFYPLTGTHHDSIVAIWEMWLEMYNIAYNKIDWSFDRIIAKIWQGILDYAKIEWSQLIC